MFRIIFSSILFFFFSSQALFAEEGFIVQSVGNTRTTEARKKLIQEVLSSDQMFFGYNTLSIIIDAGLVEPRGQMKGRSIRLSGSIPRDSEFIKLLIHEVGHYVDIFDFIAGPNLRDPSARFYSISWESPKVKKAGEGLSNFISGYASTNQYEDFAESFTFFIFHNAIFSERAIRNESLRQKYLFFSEVVFPDGAFIGSDFSIGKVPSYLWDTTKISISVKKYLYFLANTL